MNTSRRNLQLFLAIALGGLLWHLATRDPAPIARPPGVLVAEEPLQVDLPRGEAAFEHGRFKLTPLAEFAIEARLLARTRYRWDEEAELSPLDFGFGWGRMSDSSVLQELKLSHGGRFLRYFFEGQPPIPQREIDRSIANIHLIPADPGIARQLDRIAVGRVVRLEGQLVEARRSDGWRWRSSLTRTDTGHGACELLWVRAVEVVD